MMKQKYRLRIATLIALLVMAVAGMSAQPHKKGGKGAFSPERFQAEMEQYIVSHAASHQQSQLASSPSIERWARR